MTNKNEKDPTMPVHIAIIPDGNRRWATERGLSPFEGHKRGYEISECISDAAMKRGVQYMTYWGFSTDNWNRSKREVVYLMRLFKWIFTNKIEGINKKNIQLNVLGRVDEFSKELQRAIRAAIRLTKNNTHGVLNIALNYGGRAEIVDMVKRALTAKLAPQSVTEHNLEQFLYNPNMPDPDLIIRTSGEQRLSGFLPWQGTYSELYFSKKYWPDFTTRDLDRAISTYQHRQRRFGK